MGSIQHELQDEDVSHQRYLVNKHIETIKSLKEALIESKLKILISEYDLVDTIHHSLVFDTARVAISKELKERALKLSLTDELDLIVVGTNSEKLPINSFVSAVLQKYNLNKL